MTQIVEELLAAYNPAKFDSETSMLMEKFLSRAVLKYVFLQEDVESEMEIAMEIMKHLISDF